MRKIEGVLIGLAFICALPFLVIMPAFLLLRLLYSLLPSHHWAWLAIPPIFSAWVLSDTTRYVALSLLALAPGAGALLWLITRERGRFWRRRRFYLLALLIAAVLAFPLLARYRPAVAGAPGTELRIVDEPGWVEGAVKRCQAAAEISECQYEPLGWADTQTLVYRKWCGGHYTPEGWQPGEPQPPQAYNVKTGATTLFEGSIENLLGERGPRTIATLDYFPGMYARTSISPDGRWIAFTARHVYGPEDLLVMLKE